MDTEKLAVRDRKRNYSGGTLASAQRLRVGEVCVGLKELVKGWRIEFFPPNNSPCC